MSTTKAGGEVEGIVPDQFDDLGASIEIDLYLHLARWLDDPEAQVVVRGLPPGVAFDATRLTLHGEFARDTILDEGYEVRIEVRKGDATLVATRFRWTVRDRTQRTETHPPRQSAPPLTAAASGAGAAMLFSLGAQMSAMAAARAAPAGQITGADGARSAFAPTTASAGPDGSGLRAASQPAAAGGDLAITGGVQDATLEENDAPVAPAGRLRVDPFKNGGGTANAGEGAARTLVAPDLDGSEEIDTGGPITAIPGAENTAPLIDPLPPLGQIEDAPILNIDVLSNALDIDGDPMTVRSARAETGTVTVNGDGSLNYQPRQDFAGGDQITYVVDDGRGGQTTGQITIAISPVNDAPRAVDDQVTSAEDTPVTIDPLANDTDPDDGDTMTIAGASSTDGTVVVRGNVIDYTPDPDTNGPQTITYTVRDAAGLTSTASIRVDVTPVNDAPVAVADSAGTSEDAGTILFSVTGNDSDIDNAVDPASIWLAGATTAGGSVTVAGIGEWTATADGQIGFTPEPDWNGTATIDYSVADEAGLRSAPTTVTVTVAPVNDAPRAGDPGTVTLAEDGTVTVDLVSIASDVEGDAITLLSPFSSNGATVSVSPDGRSVVYEPQPDANGPDTVFYTLEDANGARTTASFDLDVTPVDDAPIARDDAATGTEDDASVRVEVLANDDDIDGTIDPESVEIAGAAPDGTLAIAGEGVWSVLPDGALSFAPQANFNGVSQVSYSVADEGGTRSDPAVATATLSPANDDPTADDDAATTAEETTVNIAVLTNDGDVDGDALTVSIDAVANGTAVLLADNSIDFTPDVDFVGDAVIDYTVDDGNGGTAAAQAVVTVTPVEDAPTANDDAATGAEDTVLVIDVVANDFDPDAGDSVDPASVAIVGAAPDGSLTVAGEGVWTSDGAGNLLFAPEPNFTGTATPISYTVADLDGDVSQPASVTATVTGVNDAPTLDLRGPASTPTQAAAWLHNDPSNATRGEVADRAALSAVGAETGGTGVTFTPGGTRLDIAGADEADFDAAHAAGDTLDLPFTAAADGTLGSFVFNSSDEGGAFTMGLLLSGDGGATFTEIARDFAPPVPTPTAHDAQIGGTYLNHHTIDISGAPLTDGQDHVLRIVFYDAAGAGSYGPGALSIDDIGFTAQPLSADIGTLFLEAGGPGATGAVTLVRPGTAQANDPEDDIVSVTIDVSGIRDPGAESLVVAFDGGPVAIDPEATATHSGAIGGVATTFDVAGAAGGGTITVSAGGVPQTGGWVVALVEALSYDNATNGATAGERTFDITLTDAAGAASPTRSAIVTVSVRNDAPSGAPQAQSVEEDGVLAAIDALLGFADPEGDAMSVVAGSVAAAHGTVTINGDGTLRYVPDADYAGPDQITYRVSDGNGNETPAAMDVTVNAVNDAPVVTGETVAGTNTATLAFDLSDNYSDVEDPGLGTDGLRFADGSTQVVQAGIGVWDLDPATGQATFSPELTFVGTATVDFTQFDGTDTSAPATLTAEVADGNLAPTDIATAGLAGTSLNNDGNNGAYLEVADPDALLAGRTEIAFAVRFSVDATDGQSYSPIVSYVVGSTDALEIGIETRNGPPHIVIEIAGERAEIYGIEALLDGARHDVSIAWNATAGDWSVSVDGAVAGSGTDLATGAAIAGGGRLLIGQEQDGPVFDPNEVFSGTLETIAFGPAGSPEARWVFGAGDLDGTAGTIADTVGGNDLTVGQVAQTGFTTARVVDTIDIGEDAAGGTLVATLATADPNAGNTHTYTLATADPFFEIVGDEIRLRAGATLDHEAEALRTLSVTTTDQGGLSHTEDVTIHIANRNEAPSAVTGTSFATGVAMNEDGGTAGHFTSAAAEAQLSGLTSLTFESAFVWSGTDKATLASYNVASGGDELGITLRDVGGQQEVHVEIGQVLLRIASNTTLLNDGARHQIGVAWDGVTGDWQLFVDGVRTSFGSGFQQGHAIAGGGTLVVAHDTDSVGVDDAVDALNGAIYATRLFGDVRTQGEIAAGQGLHLADPGLLLDYRFDDFDGAVVRDAASGADLAFGQSPFLDTTSVALVSGIAEDAAVGTVVLDLAALDPDRADTATFIIVDDPTGGAFAIDGGALVVADPSLLDADTGALPTIGIRAEDMQGLSTATEYFDVRIEHSGGNVAPADIVRDAFLTGVTLNTDAGNAGAYSIADASALLTGLTALSIDTSFAAAAPASVATTSYTLLHAHDAGGNDQINVAIAELQGTPRLYVEIADQGYTESAYDASALLDGAVHTISVNWDNAAGTIEIFVDGIVIASASGIATGAVLDGSGALLIGQESDPAGFDPAETFEGSIFGTRLFDAARASGTIAAAWNTDIDPASANLVADWRFGGDDPATVANAAASAPAGSALGFVNVAGAGFSPTAPAAITGIVESAPAGAVVMRLSTSDADAGDRHEYTLDDPSGTFVISDDELVVGPGATLDPSAGPIAVTVTTTDLAGATRTETYAIEVLAASVPATPAFRSGTPQADVMTADMSAVTFYARGDDDTLTGGARDDVLHGQDGADQLSGGAGNDVLHGDRSAQATDSVGAVRQVNEAAAGNQSPPVAVALEDGRSLLVWYGDALSDGSAGNTLTGRFLADDGTPVGEAFAIGTARVEVGAEHPMPPLRADRLADGNVMVTWQVDDTQSTGGTNDLATAIVDVGTGVVRPETQLQALSGQPLSGGLVVPLDAGGALIVWYHDSGPGADETVAAHRLDADGRPVGPVIPLGTDTVREAPGFDLPNLSAVDLGGGRVLVGWSSQGSGDTINGVVHDTASGLTSGTFALAQAAQPLISPPVMVALAGGGAFVAWYENAASNNDPTMTVHGRFLGGDGQPAGAPVTIGTSWIEGFDGTAAVPLRLLATGDGGVAVGFAADSSTAADGDRGAAVVVMVEANGTVGPERVVNQDPAYDPSAPILLELGDGRIFAVWIHNALNDGAGAPSVLQGRFLDAAGVPQGAAFDISTIPAEGADALDLDSFTATLTADGDVLVAWASDDASAADGDGSAVLSVLVSTQAVGGGDTLTGGAGDDLLVGDGQTWVSDIHELDPVAFWRFDDVTAGDPVDHSGNGHGATYRDGAGHDTAGRSPESGAARLDGVDDHIVVAADPAFDMNEGTIVGWFNADVLGDQTIMSRVSNDPNAGEQLTISITADGRLVARSEPGDGSGDMIIVWPAGSVSAGTWHSFAFTFGAGGSQLFLDGVPLGGPVAAFGTVFPGQDWIIGASAAGSPPGSNAVVSDHFGGRIDDIAILPTALDAAAVGALHAAADDRAQAHDDTLAGGDGDDRLLGGGGDDVLDGGAGADVLDGGAGNDTVDYSSASAGIDALFADTDGAGIEGVAYIDADAGGRTGEAAGDTYSEIELVIGSAFDDRIYAARTDFTAHLGDGNDVYDTANDYGGVDTVFGEAGNDRIFAANGDDVLSGGAGDDVLWGENGADDLQGGLDDDVLDGGRDADRLDGGDGFDTASYASSNFAGSGGGVDVLFSAADAEGIDGAYAGGAAGGRTNHAAGDTFVSIERFEGSDHADRVFGANGDFTADLGGGDDVYDTFTADNGIDTVSGGAGNDLIRAGGGDDVVNGGSGDDVIEGERGNDTLSGGTGNDVIRGGANADQIFGGADDDVLYGDLGDDTIDGGAGDDILHSGFGNDTLMGGEGADTFHTESGSNIARGGDGDDLFIGSAAVDAYFGDAGFDTVDYSASDAGVVLLLSDTDEFGLGGDYVSTPAGGQEGDAAGDRYTSIEQVIGTAFNDRVYGSEDGVLVYLGDGDDEFDNAGAGPPIGDQTSANDGNDVVWAGSGTDVLDGGYGDDRLYGEEGDDVIRAGEGDDLVRGGEGNDTIDMGAGTDTVSYLASSDDYDVRDNGDGTYTITDLRPGSPDGVDTVTGAELIDFSGQAPVAIADVADRTVTGTNAGETLTTAGGNDTIYALDGDDTIDAGTGNDTVHAGAGNDAIVAGGGHDLVDGGSGTNVVVLSGLPADYTVYRNSDGSYTLVDERPGAPDGQVHMIGIDDLRFSDLSEVKPSDIEVAAPSPTIVGDANANTLTGTAGVDVIDAGDGDDTIDAGDGNDFIRGGGGNDVITGGAGNDYIEGDGSDDTAVYSGNLADYEIHKNSNSSFTITDLRPGSPDGRDVVTDVKFLQFADQTVEPKDHETVSPIAFDLDGSGAIETTGETTARERFGTEIGETVGFDMDGDGDLEAIEWLAGTGDALLVDDTDGRALDDMNGTRLFGDQGGRFEHGYAQLAGRDGDGDGRIAGAELEGLALWVDDGDARAEEGELFTLADFGIEAISVETEIAHDGAGRELVRSHAERSDGSRLMSEDVWFALGDEEALRLRPMQDEETRHEEVA